jgi:hypothetical protein
MFLYFVPTIRYKRSLTYFIYHWQTKYLAWEYNPLILTTIFLEETY